ncbi:hypothetical protein Hanom_Chr03g00190021 [Helianthus anomalus]
MQGISKVDELSNKITQSDEQKSQNRSNRKFVFQFELQRIGGLWLCGRCGIHRIAETVEGLIRLKL